MTVDPELEQMSAAPRDPGLSTTALSLEDVHSAIATMPYGGSDDSTRDFRLPPMVRAAVSPVLAALRWGAVMTGVVFAAPKAADGDLHVVSTLTVVLFFTSWRTFRPNRLASTRPLDRALALTDALIVGFAVGWSGALESPFAICALATVVVAAFGWGALHGFWALVVSIGAMALGRLWTDTGTIFGDNGMFNSQSSLTLLVSMLAAIGLASFARNRLLDAEQRRQLLAGQVEALAETNDLLHLLNDVARTLPTSLDLREAVESTRLQLTRAFRPGTLCLMVRNDSSGEWSPQIADGCAARPSSSHDELPAVLQGALEAGTATLATELAVGDGIGDRSRSGMYAVLSSRDRVVGVLGVEHHEAATYHDRDLRILAGLADVLALTVDNARWFGRLRTLGADEERSRIARDLHDRLGQWLTYISFELERIIAGADQDNDELESLHDDVQHAIDELRETLRQLRTGVSEGESLAVVARQVVDRFDERSELDVDLRVAHPGRRLPVPVENELLRILQESLANIEKHAKASTVDIVWDVNDDGGGTMRIADDGVGFDVDAGVRETAYGLVGMRERADAIGARLTITSQSHVGTTITVAAGSRAAVPQHTEGVSP